jgi:UDP-arabinose 4-epimerase
MPPSVPQRRVLVTGGAGYVGSHTCKALARAGYVPVTIDNLIHGHRSAVRWGPFIEGDLADRRLLERVMHEHAVEAVLHFAAYAYVGESMLAPGKYFANNVSNSLNLLEAMRSTGVDTIVFSSTCATYGLPDSLPIEETHAQHPVNPYGESKLFVERALHWYQQAHGMRWAALRYFNAAGADPAGEIGEQHEPETHLLPIVIEAALGRRQSVEIYGTDYATPDGTAIRDYVHVTDLADAHVKSLGLLLDGTPSLELNLGTGVGHSVLEVVQAVEAYVGRPVATRERPRRPGDPPVLVAAASLARRTLGWRPSHSSLETIVESAHGWHARGSSRMRRVPESVIAAT